MDLLFYSAYLYVRSKFFTVKSYKKNQKTTGSVIPNSEMNIPVKQKEQLNAHTLTQPHPKSLSQCTQNKQN